MSCTVDFYADPINTTWQCNPVLAKDGK